MIDFHHDVRLDQSETLFFKLPLTDGKVEWLVPDATLRWRDKLFFISKKEVVHSGEELLCSIEADALWYRLGEQKRVGSVVLDNMTPELGLQEILIGSGWSRGADTTTSADTYTMEMEDATILKLVREWAKVTNTFVVFNSFEQTVSLVTERGLDQGTPFRYGRNLRKILKRESPPRVTRLYGYGADDLNVAGVNGGLEYVEDFSWYTNRGLTLLEAQERFTKKDVIYDQRFVEDSALLAFLEAQMAEMAQGLTEYEADVIDLIDAFGVGELPVFQVGDSARVADEVAGIDVFTTVVRMDRYPEEPWRSRIELDSMPKVPGQTSPSSRPSSALQWQQAGSDSSERRLTNGGTQVINRIGLRFREGGEAHFGYDLTFTGVGTGSLAISAMDAESDTLLHPVLSIPYTHDQVIHEAMTWWMEDLVGQYDFRIRMVAVSDPFAASGGVNIADSESKFWIMYHGAVRQTPTLPNSVVYDFTGAVQTFEVPDGVTEVTIECKGSEGGGANVDFPAGLGGRVVAILPVISGATYDVYVGGVGSGSPNGTGGWPNGGNGGDTGANAGSGGGGSSDVRPQGGSMADTLLCAAGGGGCGDRGGGIDGGPGGDGRFFQGASGFDQTLTWETIGGSQIAGGAGGSGGWGVGGYGAFDSGGDGQGSGNAFRFGGGGGGGGYYGGEGGFLDDPVGGDGSNNANAAGAGGSGWIHPSGYDLEIDDGSQTGAGQVVISWETPE